MDRDGVSGIWMPEIGAKKMLADGKELDATKVLVKDLEAKIALKDERIVVIHEALSAAEMAERRAIETLDIAIAAKEEAEAKMRAWYRHPVFWVTIGVVLTIGLEVGAVKVIQAAN